MLELNNKLIELNNNYRLVKTLKGFRIYYNYLLVVEKFTVGTCYYDVIPIQELNKIISLVNEYISRSSQ